MEELLEKIESEINSIKEEQAKLGELTEKSSKLQEEEKQLSDELSTIQDTKSGFYQDAKQKLDEKHQEFTEANNNRMSKEKEVDKLIDEKKAEIRKQIAAQKQYLDENRNVDLADLKSINIDKLRAEKEKLDREIELNSITREEFNKKSDSEKKEIRKAKENYLNNKKRLAEVNPKLQLIDTLDGKTPKEKFIELDNLDRNIEANFNKDNLENIDKNIHKSIDKRKEEKDDIETLLEQMIAGREKREEERYYEDVKSGLEETKNRMKREQEEMKADIPQEEPKDLDEDTKKKIEQVKKETQAANKDYKNIHLNMGPEIDKTQINIKKETEKIASIRINEKSGTIYTKTKNGKIEKETLEEAIAAKKNLYVFLKIKEMCKEMAGGRIQGLLLGTKVNPAIIYALRKDPKEIKEYITSLKEKKELPFELFHDLRSSSLSVMNRVKMWVHARAEDKIPGTTVIISDRVWNKNKALEAAKVPKEPENRTKAQKVDKPFEMYKQVIRDKDKPITAYQVKNDDNHIEKNATDRILKEEEQKRAKEVQKLKGDAILDKNGKVVTNLGENKGQSR